MQKSSNTGKLNPATCTKDFTSWPSGLIPKVHGQSSIWKSVTVMDRIDRIKDSIPWSLQEAQEKRLAKSNSPSWWKQSITRHGREFLNLVKNTRENPTANITLNGESRKLTMSFFTSSIRPRPGGASQGEEAKRWEEKDPSFQKKWDYFCLQMTWPPT